MEGDDGLRWKKESRQDKILQHMGERTATTLDGDGVSEVWASRLEPPYIGQGGFANEALAF